MRERPQDIPAIVLVILTSFRAVSIHFLAVATALLCLQAAACSAGGPPFRADPPAPAAPFGGRFSFDLPVSVYASAQLGEVVLEPSTRDPDFTAFHLRFVGRTRDRSIRMRSYEGRAVVRGDTLELRSERCYLFGKRELEARLVPQERWDCHHLIFSFRSSDGFRRRLTLTAHPTSAGRYADWLGHFDLVPLPLADGVPLTRRVDRSRDAYFAGRVFETLPSGQVVVWGYRAGYLLKRGDILEAAGKAGAGVAGLRVISHPGSFLITEPNRRSSNAGVKPGQIFFTNRWPKVEGLFGFGPAPDSGGVL